MPQQYLIQHESYHTAISWLRVDKPLRMSSHDSHVKNASKHEQQGTKVSSRAALPLTARQPHVLSMAALDG